MSEKKVFLGGTWNGSMWREVLIPTLEIDYFNPIVDNWTPEWVEEEKRQKKECDYVLYVITPRMKGVYSIAEAVEDSNKQPEKTIFCYLLEDFSDDKKGKISFDKDQIKSLDQVGKMIQDNGGKFITSLTDVIKFLNR